MLGDPLDATYEIDGRPYEVRDITIDEFEEFVQIGLGRKAPEGTALMRAQMAFLLRGPDGQPPTDEELGKVKFREWRDILNAITGAHG